MTSHNLDLWTLWDDELSGDGAMSVSGNVLTASSGLTTGRAYKKQRIACSPGDIIELTCDAKLISTAGYAVPGGPRIGLTDENEDVGTHVEIRERDWTTYTCQYQVPKTFSDRTFVRANIGSYLNDGGSAKFAHPRLKILNPTWGTPRVMAWGLLRFDLGVMTIVGDFVRAGITGFSYNSSTKIGTLSIPKCNAYGKPLFTVTPYAEGAKHLRPMVKTYDDNGGTVLLNWYDSTGTIADISGISNIYLSFKMEV